MNTVAANPDQWSARSKRSVAYLVSPPTRYMDIPYICWKCEADAVFTAEQQQHAFEVRKVYIGQLRILCENCFGERVRMEHEISSLGRRWKTNRASMLRDVESLRRWLHLLIEVTGYGAAANTANAVMLRRLLEKMAPNNSLKGTP